ncbi:MULTISPECIES: hypothetical protein [unclassified Cytobacillus]|uniref:hypothetical protein n=1 Tax=unclassified Cytobacillus TaxID=2675268 RepID=UPI00203D24D7|nr:hypothetical protein [Cytobacillus sp. AMY 15.2]MCM3090181.1 hypothetical protein [Cytobacillus sp. AMY 15.2]
MAIDKTSYYLSAGTATNVGILTPRLAIFVESQIIFTLKVPALNAIRKSTTPYENKSGEPELVC